MYVRYFNNFRLYISFCLPYECTTKLFIRNKALPHYVGHTKEST